MLTAILDTSLFVRAALRPGSFLLGDLHGVVMAEIPKVRDTVHLPKLPPDVRFPVPNTP